MTTTEFTDALKLYIEGQQHLINEYWKQMGFTYAPPDRVETEEGKRYVRVVRQDARGSSRSAMAFVDKTTGDVFKAASWKAPAKHARGNIFDEYNGLKTATAHGPAYLR